MTDHDAAAEVRAVRAALGLTQHDLAARLGVTVQTVSRWENGHKRPLGVYRDKLRRLAAPTRKSAADARLERLRAVARMADAMKTRPDVPTPIPLAAINLHDYLRLADALAALRPGDLGDEDAAE